MIDELLAKYQNLYQEMKIDIYIYDSSSNDNTFQVVQKWKECMPNLYYRRYDASLHSNLKVYQILQSQDLIKKYKYVWVNSDSIRWSRRVYEAVQANLAKDYDMIVINYRDKEHIGNRVYGNQQEFFEECAWHLTLYGAALVRTDTMLHTVPWEYLTEKYTLSGRIYHSHVAFYFEQILSLPEFSALHLSFGNEDLSSSPLKKCPGWQTETFYVWGDCWPDMIRALPDYYENRTKVIKMTGIYGDILTWNGLIILRKKNILTKEIWKKYRKRWKNLTNVFPPAIWMLSVMPPELFHWIKIVVMHTWIVPKTKINLLLFCRKYDHIYLYGAGEIARILSGLMDQLHIKYEGYFVTSLQENRTMLKGKPIRELSAQFIEDSRIGIVVALGYANRSEVLPILLEMGLEKRLCVLEDWI
jgi:hypothetical protein